MPLLGYINNPGGSPAMDPVATWAAGSAQSYSVSGTATHGGGSCQLSLSYDQGATWTVIHSVIGGCMVEGLTDLPFTLPASAPSGTALFAWAWFNHLGNREMYQNCAVVTITGGGAGLEGPTPFVANAGVNECHTLEGIDVVFPEPGSSVQYGGAYTSSKPTAPAGFTGSNCVGPNAKSGASNGGAAAPTSAANATTAVSNASSIAASSTAVVAEPSASVSNIGNAHLATGSESIAAAAPTVPAASAPAGVPVACRRRKRSARRHAREFSS